MRSEEKNLWLSAESKARIEAWVNEGYPNETCGLLIGKRNGAAIDVRKVVAARNLNVERAQDRFELDPKDFLAADEKARVEGLELVGCWHSHPNHRARPSPTDREFAWAGWCYLIASVTRDGIAELRSFYFDGDKFSEQLIEP
ncbi:MAG: Mov34/MPN/PAD-1 family protein [Burkholderiales bacterium]